MDLEDVRRSFTGYFAGCGHVVVPSASLVPANDPTLLFTNAGMVPFKDVFLGLETRPYRRAVSIQRCVRAGGKHNDLENVGYTARHHTFFEMLGNFSFGDYFKEEAIPLAWNYLTRTLGLDRERLWVTVHPEDDEAYTLWQHAVGIPESRLRRIPGDDNFWSMGETGPCGPSTEIFYDHGPGVAGGPPGSETASGDRFVEIWNLVFMQFDRDARGLLTPLPQPCVDTGMGLERIAAVLEGVVSNYDIAFFRTLTAEAAHLLGVAPDGSSALRVIADHVRAATFLIMDGVRPGNEGRGYVLRRLIRRAYRHGFRLGAGGAFLYRLVPVVGRLMAGAYPELTSETLATASGEIRREEERFADTLVQGLAVLEEGLGALSGRTIPGPLAFRLADTYGFPIDLLLDTARERGYTVDVEGFEAELAAQRERARRQSAFGAAERIRLESAPTTFSGYEGLESEATIAAVATLDGEAAELAEGERGILVLDRTPFYAESGGQVGDTGRIESETLRFRVTDTRREGSHILHHGIVEVGRIRPGERVHARVDGGRRRDIMRNHSATHLLHAALRQVLGPHVTQQGSLVAPDRLRFDFSHSTALTPAEREAVERLVMVAVVADHPVETRVMAFDEARHLGAMALFGEKYGERVRVLRMGEVSLELCGGTHVQRTGEIGGFHIVGETALASGVRRIEAVTGLGLTAWLADLERERSGLAALVGTGADGWTARIRQMQERERELTQTVRALKRRLVAGGEQAPDAWPQAVGDVQVVARRIDGADVTSLREGVDRLRSQLGKAIVVLATVEDGTVRLVSGVTPIEARRVPARELVAHLAARIGGRGGGRADLAEGGGGDPAGLDAALAEVLDWVRARLGGGTG
jgi:alanyl-tRNA synthetase